MKDAFLEGLGQKYGCTLYMAKYSNLKLINTS